MANSNSQSLCPIPHIVPKKVYDHWVRYIIKYKTGYNNRRKDRKKSMGMDIDGA